MTRRPRLTPARQIFSAKLDADVRKIERSRPAILQHLTEGLNRCGLCHRLRVFQSVEGRKKAFDLERISPLTRSGDVDCWQAVEVLTASLQVEAALAAELDALWFHGTVKIRHSLRKVRSALEPAWRFARKKDSFGWDMERGNRGYGAYW